MSTRLYKINGEYNTFEYWHDHYGYTRTPTFSVQYKTTNPWGATFSSGGYYDAEDLMDIFTFSFFVPGVVGWYSIDDLALVGYYPAAATDLTVARDSEVSNAATLTQDNETYYLVQNDIQYGWMSQAEFEARGWSTDVGDPPSYIVFDTTTGTIVHSIVDEGLVYGDVGYALMDEAPQMIVIPTATLPLETFYLNSEGREATENHYLSLSNNPIYDGDGNDILYDDISDLHGHQPFYFMQVDGNVFSAASSDSLINLSGGKAGIGAVGSVGKEAWSVSFERQPADVLTLWAKVSDGSEKLYYQSKVINTSTPNATYLYELYTDEGLTQRFVFDSTKNYEWGVFVNGVWMPQAIQDISQMPSTTTSSAASSVSALLLTNQNGASYLWAVTNFTSSTYSSAAGNKHAIKVKETPKPEIVLKVKWGDTVNVPSGYKVSEVRTFVGYANKSYYGGYSQWEQLATYEGKNKYFDNIDGHNLIITSTNSATDSSWPLIVASQGYQLNNTTGPHMQVLDFGAGYKNTTSYWGFSDAQTNGTDAQAGDFSVLLRGQASSTIINAINSGYPVRFLWFIIDGEGNAVWHKTPEAFRVPNSLWSFVNGVFSWLGNSEDTSSLAWYYKHDWELFEWEEFDGVWFYVHCLYDPTPEPPAPSELTAYFTNAGAAGTYDTSIRTTDYPYLYDESGVRIPYDSSKTYTVIEVRQYNGTILTVLRQYSSISGDSSGLYFHQIAGRYNVYAVTYKVS